MSILLLILGLLLFVGLVVVHEWGHFIMARRNGVEVEEFGIGFPPTFWRKKVKSPKGDFEFTLNALPLGGFVRLKGENDEDKSPGSFGAASTLSKIKIMVAGVVMNLFTAFAMLTLLAIIGIPRLIDNQFTIASDTQIIQHDILAIVGKSAPAPKAGIKNYDKIVSIEQTSNCENLTCSIVDIKQPDDLKAITSKLAGETVNLKIVRRNEIQSVPITLNTQQFVDANNKEVKNCLNDNKIKNKDECSESQGFLGILPREFIVQRSTWSAPIVAIGLIKQMTELTLKGLGSALSGVIQRDGAKASEQVAGPVGIVVLLKDGSLLGVEFILFIIAIISLTLAIMNALPIPALDGGKLFVTLAYRVISKPLTKKAEDRIHGTGFVLLMLLFVLITIVDVKRFF